MSLNPPNQYQADTIDDQLQFLPPRSPPPTAAFSPVTLLSPVTHDSEPTTPTTTSLPETKDGKQKRPNPLTDLVETERSFVDQLTGIIRKIAAAWSRSNLPPPELDTMFRSIESIYRANRGLHAKLKDISADPRSAGELGGLLINWIDDLQKPYESYCAKYSCGFDEWEPVISNVRLGEILLQFSASNPALTNDGVWTLDSLFLLPKTRLTYYLKLYKRLLKNTQNPLLVNAVGTLNRLLDTFDSRSSVKVGEDRQRTSNVLSDGVDEVVIDMRMQTLSPSESVNRPLNPDDTKTGSETSSNQGSVSAGERSSRESNNTSFSRTSTQTLSMPIADLERRLAVDRTLDIFTMTPKAVKLQMSPPNLTFTREMRTSVDVVIRFTPRATGLEVIHKQGHIFILSDLFLICERMKPEEQQQSSNPSSDMWLCYPPLSGKVLRLSEIDGQSNAIQIAIMRKEFLILETRSHDERDNLISHMKDCVEFSASVPPPSKNPPPPLPSFNAFPRLQSDNASFPGLSSSGMIHPSRSESMEKQHFPMDSNMHRPDVPLGPPPPPDASWSAPPSLRTSASAQPLSRGPSLGSGPVTIPPARSTSFIPGGTDGPHQVLDGSRFGLPSSGPAFVSSSMTNLAPHGNVSNVRLPHNPLPPLPSLPPSGMYPLRSPSEPSVGPGRPPIYQAPMPPPLQPYLPNGMAPMSSGPLNHPFPGGSQMIHSRPVLPSQAQRELPATEALFNEPSPPNSPEVQARNLGPVTSTISAQMKCKVFLQQQHAQWKSLGSAKLKLYRQDPTNIKQLVVEADNKDKSVLISTIVLTDGVERVGKTGVAIELSDKGARTGIVYMIQLRNETSAGGLFDSLLAGSDRSAR